MSVVKIRIGQPEAFVPSAFSPEPLCEVMATAFYDNRSIKNRLDFFDKEQCDSYRVTKLTTTLPSAAEYTADLATLRDETYVKIITGELPIEAYDEYVAE